MSKYKKLLVIIREARERLKDESISKEEADAILNDVWKEYNEMAAADRDPAIHEMLRDIFKLDDRKDLNLLF